MKVLGGCAVNDLQMDYFVSVAQTGSFSLSAKLLYVSTPAVSKQITALESELGLKLFSRTSKGAELTEAGAMLLDYVLRSRQHLAKVLREARGAQNQPGHIFRLAVMEDWAVGEQLRAIREFLSRQIPPLELNIYGSLGREMFDWLDLGDVDAVLAISGDCYSAPAQRQLFSRHLTYISRGFFYSAHDPLARKRNLKPSDFSGRRLFTLPNSTRALAQEQNELLCRSLGFQPEIRPMERIASIAATLASGDGFAIFDEWSVNRFNPELAWLPLPERHAISLFWAQNTPVNRALAEFCAELFKG